MKKLFWRKVLHFVFVGLVCLLIGYGAAYFQFKNKIDSLVRGEYDLVIKTQVETADSMLQTLYDKSKKGEMSLVQAKKLGADLLRELRYYPDKTGYFWADTSNGTNVVLYGRTDTEGKNRWDSYVGGVYHVREIVNNGKLPGGGFTDYFYTKMGEKDPLPKRGYSLWFKPFDWIVGTGYYVNDVNQRITQAANPF